jgi:hypothetical protein
LGFVLEQIPQAGGKHYQEQHQKPAAPNTGISRSKTRISVLSAGVTGQFQYSRQPKIA